VEWERVMFENNSHLRSIGLFDLLKRAGDSLAEGTLEITKLDNCDERAVLTG
jgi:hypothetical protein